MSKTCFFTIVDDRYYYPVGTHVLVNSFKKFHPDIDLVVFRQDQIDKTFFLKGINFYQAKPTFAKLLVKDYERVINIDADTIITHRLDEVLDTDWEVGAVWNFNLYENTSVENVKETDYVQAGMVGSTNPEFWDIWERENKKAMSYKCQENDILNLVWYNDSTVSKMKRLIWDRKENYLGCKSLGLEDTFYVEDNLLKCNGQIVKAYHWARGAKFPKLDFRNPEIPFSQDAANWLTKIAMEGVSVKYSSL